MFSQDSAVPCYATKMTSADLSIYVVVNIANSTNTVFLDWSGPTGVHR